MTLEKSRVEGNGPTKTVALVATPHGKERLLSILSVLDEIEAQSSHLDPHEIREIVNIAHVVKGPPPNL